VPEFPESIQRVVDAAARRGFPLEVVEFAESTHTAEEAARAVGADVGQIVKSLVFISESPDGVRPCLVLASGANRVDLELLAAQLTEPHIRRATADEARQLTGFVIGGIPPFGHIRPIRAIMDPDLTRYETVWASAGTPNAVFAIAPATLRALANAVITQIAAERGPQQAQQPAGAPIV
jgi:prolyl-tRNA editing enzyme YbaK/EbsC (Cys-tRNA(Pro) deacylase)